MPVVFYHSIIHGLGFFICKINVPSLMPDENKNFGGALESDDVTIKRSILKKSTIIMISVR